MAKTDVLKRALLADGPLRLDGVTFYLHGDSVRMCSSKRDKRKTRTEKEIASSSHFSEVRKMWSICRRALGDLPVWRAMAREMGRSKADSLFHSVNGGCIRAGEGVWAFSRFCFSVGVLDAPVLTAVGREGWQVTLAWGQEEERPKASASDRLYLGYFYATQPRAPQMLAIGDACRGDGHLTVTIPDKGE